MNNNYSDENIRLEAQDLSKSFIVQAPAGSGKTEILVQRYLSLLATVTAPEEIIAITFTKKAAYEMRTRVITALQSALKKQPTNIPHKQRTQLLAKKVLQQNEKLNWDILKQPNRFRIQTIDAFASHIVRQLPILSHLGTLPEIATFPEYLYEKAVLQLLQHKHDIPELSNAFYAVIAWLDCDLEKLIKFLKQLLSVREQWIPLITNLHQSKNIFSLLDLFKKLYSDIIAYTVNSLSKKYYEELFILYQYASSQLQNKFTPITTIDKFLNSTQVWSFVANWLLTKTGSLRKTVTKAQGFFAINSFATKEEKVAAKQMKQRMLALLENLRVNKDFIDGLNRIQAYPENISEEYNEKLVFSISELLIYLMGCLIVEFKQTAKVDFTEILRAAVLSLRNSELPTDIQLKLDYQIQHLLIDEFQDTSYAQYELFKYIVTPWQYAQDNRTLFIVGDPMQSIYSFRQAEVSLFLNVINHGIGGIQLKYLQLTTNFRSSCNLVDYFNKVFKNLFPLNHNINFSRVAYLKAHGVKQSSIATQQCFNTEIFSNDYNEAAHVVEYVQKILQTTSQDSIAILVRARKHLLPIINLLKQKNIAYLCEAVESLTQHMLIQDLYSILCVLYDASDSLSLYSVLRSPLIGLSLNEMEQLTNIADTNVLIALRSQQFLNYMEEFKQTRIIALANFLEYLFYNRERNSYANLIKITWKYLKGTSFYNKPQHQQLYEKFIDLVHSHIDQQAVIDLTSFYEILDKTLVESGTVTARVHVMTIHKAKGLEFTHVIIPGLNKRVKNYDANLITWYTQIANDQQQVLFAPINNLFLLNSQPHSNKTLYKFLKKMQELSHRDELIRVLYVALTRARQTLLLTATCENMDAENTEGIKPKKGSPLNLLWPNLPSVSYNFDNDSEHNGTKVELSPYHYILPGVLDYQQIALIPEETSKLNRATNESQHLRLYRLAGTFAHQLLQVVAEQGLEVWKTKNIELYNDAWKKYFINLNFSNKQAEFITLKIITMFNQLLNSNHAKFILAKHKISHSEYGITINDNSLPKQIRIDRTFVDDKNVRWVIDYKFLWEVDHINDDLKLELLTRYKQQIYKYITAFEKFENRLIYACLYLPLQDLILPVPVVHSYNAIN